MEAAASMVVETQDDNIEEGEISDSEYTPLPRPVASGSGAAFSATNPNRFLGAPLSSDEHDSTESDSDSDAPRLPKARRLCKPVHASKPAVPAKYTVWNQDLQEAALNEKLLNCDVELKYDKSRDVESYDYTCYRNFATGHSPSDGDVDDLSSDNKRGHEGDLRNLLSRKEKVKQRDNSGSDSDGVGNPKPRYLLALKEVGEESTKEAVARDITNKLMEQKEGLVMMSTKVLGIPRVVQLFNKTRDIEADGGMMVLNGKRRRTPGGVFFWLLRNETDITRDQHDAIFQEDWKSVVMRKRKERLRKRETNVAKLRAAEADRLEAELPALLSRAEQMVKNRELGEESGTEDGEVLDEPEQAAGSNPPPSPAADNNEDVIRPDLVLDVRQVTSYVDDDDFLDVGGTDDIDMF